MSIQLYKDKDLKSLVQRNWIDGRMAWHMNFGYLNAGHERTFSLFLENQSNGLIEDLEITVEPIKTTDGDVKEGVEILVLGGKVKRLKSGAVHEFRVRWAASKGLKAGKCQAAFNIYGWITEE